jgi:hypothetical protein
MRPEGFTDEEWNYIDTVVKEAFPEMESHVEIFTLPSGRELWMYCDGTWRVEEEK